MQLCIRELNCWNDDIIETYKKEFILSLNTDINNGIYIELEQSDYDGSDWDSIDAIIHLCSQTKIALIMLDCSAFFEVENAIHSPYRLYEPDPEYLTMAGRHVISYFRQELEKQHFSALPIYDNPHIVYFGMCHSGLVY